MQLKITVRSGREYNIHNVHESFGYVMDVIAENKFITFNDFAIQTEEIEAVELVL